MDVDDVGWFLMSFGTKMYFRRGDRPQFGRHLLTVGLLLVTGNSLQIQWTCMGKYTPPLHRM